MDKNNQHYDFQSVWEHRHSWRDKVDGNIPDDETVLLMADHAREMASLSETAAMPLNTRHRGRWIPYAAAASLVTGIVLVGVNNSKNLDNHKPKVQKVVVEGHTMYFICNNDCSVQDVMYAANDVIKH